MENCFRPIFVKSSLGAMALTNDSVSRYLEEIQKKEGGVSFRSRATCDGRIYSKPGEIPPEGRHDILFTVVARLCVGVEYPFPPL